MTEKPDCMDWQCNYCGNANKDATYCYKYERRIEYD